MLNGPGGWWVGLDEVGDGYTGCYRRIRILHRQIFLEAVAYTTCVKVPGHAGRRPCRQLTSCDLDKRTRWCGFAFQIECQCSHGEQDCEYWDDHERVDGAYFVVSITPKWRRCERHILSFLLDIYFCMHIYCCNERVLRSIISIRG